MATVMREIEALGGAQTKVGEYHDGYHAGYSDALIDAGMIGENADALIDELVEWIADVLNGDQPLDRWSRNARDMLERLKHRRAS